MNYSLADIYFINSQDGWLLDSPNQLFITHDGGTTWTPFPLNFSGSIFSLHFVTENTGWLLNGGKIFQSNDGGQNWTLQSNNLSFYLMGLYFLNETLGWATTNNGIILNTIDGGFDWNMLLNMSNPITTPLSMPPLPHPLNRFYKPLFLNSSYGWVLHTSGISGEFNQIYHTNDTGITWSNHSIPSLYSFKEMIFTDPFNGWLLNTQGKLFSTNDSGKTWMNQNLSENMLRDIYFLNQTHGWVCGDYGTLLNTQNGGMHWENLLNSSVSTYFAGLIFLNETKGWLFSRSTMYISQDGGISLNAVQLEPIIQFSFQSIWIWLPILLTLSYIIIGSLIVTRIESVRKSWLLQKFQLFVNKMERSLFTISTKADISRSIALIIGLFYGLSLGFVFIHEFAHAFMTVLVGAYNHSVEISLNLSGLTHIDGSFTLFGLIFIYFAGSLGVIVLGILLMKLLSNRQQNRPFNIVIIIILSYVTVISDLIAFTFYPLFQLNCDAFYITWYLKIPPYSIFLVFLPFLVISIYYLGKFIYKFYKTRLESNSKFLSVMLVSFVIYLLVTFLLFMIPGKIFTISIP